MFHRCKAFTLVELVIVVAIAAFLVALLLPVYRQMRSASDSITCASNMEKLGAAIAAYVQDNNGYLPCSEPPSLPDPNNPKKRLEVCKWARWHSALVGSGYIEGKTDRFKVSGPATLFKCPADYTIPQDSAIDQGGIGSSYVVNNKVMPFASSEDAGGGPFKLSKYKNRAGRLTLTEKDGIFGRPHGGLVGNTNQDVILKAVKGRHGRGGPDGICNVLFLDFHVEGRSVKEVIQPAVRANQKEPNADPKNLWGIRAED